MTTTPTTNATTSHTAVTAGLFLDTIPEDSDLELPPSVSSVTGGGGGGGIGAGTASDVEESLEEPQHDAQQPPGRSWWRLRTATLLQQQPSQQHQQQRRHYEDAGDEANPKWLSSAPSLPSDQNSNMNDYDDDDDDDIAAPPSSTGAMEAGRVGSVASEAGAVIVGEDSTNSHGHTSSSHYRPSRRGRGRGRGGRHGKPGDPKRRSKRPVKPLPTTTTTTTTEDSKIRAQRFYILVVLFILVVAGVIVGIVFAVKSTKGGGDDNNTNDKNNNTNTTATLAPTPSPSSVGADDSGYAPEVVQMLDDILFNISGSSWINQTDSPQYLARHWLLHVDELDVVGSLPSGYVNVTRRVMQRYILCLLYWNFNAPEGLLNSTAHECDWDGIRCYDNETFSKLLYLPGVTVTSTDAVSSDGNITSIPLDVIHTIAWPKSNLTGTVPQELGHLSWLHKLQLDQNYLTGTLPLEAWAQHPWTQLRQWSMFQNQIRGNLSATASSFWKSMSTNLYYLDLSYNQLTGPLFDWTELTSLGYLYLSNNLLTGNIHGTSSGNTSNNSSHRYLADVTSLSFSLPNPLSALDFSSNHLTGSISSFNWSMFPQLQYLLLQNNSLSGPLTAAVEKNSQLPELLALTNLFYLDLSSNQLTGPLLDWSSFVMLSSLYLSDNHFTGPLGEPPFQGGSSSSGSSPSAGSVGVSSLEFAVLTVNSSTGASVSTTSTIFSTLEDVRVSNNHLTGTLTSTWAALPFLKTLVFFGNELNGTLPTSWTSDSLEYIDLSHNQFSGSIPESLLELNFIQRVYLNNNQFRQLPPGDQYSETLQVVSLDANQLQGTIPPKFGQNWTNLTVLDLRNNTLLTGTLGVCNVTLLEADCNRTSTTTTTSSTTKSNTTTSAKNSSQVEASLTTTVGVTCDCCTQCY